MNTPAAAAELTPDVRQQPIPAAFLDALKQRFGAQCTTAQALREQHGRDESPFQVPPPAAVVFAESADDVQAAVQLCARYRVPLIPLGVGSSLEGQLLAVRGGISLDVSRMNKILAVNTEDLTVTVQPGVTREQLNEEIRDTGFFFPIDPGANASLGGMTSTRASGTNAVRYGTMRENVRALKAVTAKGELIRTGTHAKKSSAGYDLTHLLVGSEGTLAVITEITLRIYPRPEAISAALCYFPTIADAVDTVIQIVQMGIPIARVELLDANTVRMINAYSKLTLQEGQMLMMEFHGSPAGVKEQAEAVQAIAGEHHGAAFEWADKAEDRTRLWEARHKAYFAAVASRPGCRCVTTDTCVPISHLADAMLDTVKEANASGIPYFLVGHVGDGNFHMGYLIDPNDAAERAQAEALNDQLVRRALKLGGTCTGEHGIGLHKMRFLVEEAGDGALDLMRAVKKALDPDGILNPGKIFTL